MKTKVNTKKKVSTKPKTKALKQGAVSGRLSSYAKMKLKYEERIRQLQDDVTTLVEDKDFMKVTVVKNKWRIQRDMENAIWMGSPTCH